MQVQHLRLRSLPHPLLRTLLSLIINAAAFSIPTSGRGDLGRNALRGFGATQWDLTLRRQFRLTERISLQARGDFFNILNHPNFGSPVNYLSDTAQFGQATQMLNNYLGGGGQSGGLNPLYQLGGHARSSSRSSFNSSEKIG